ncbi:MAG TPA: formate/nitrite transporter family protein [Bryobacteraceae bacterium]|nr:formate/nitrite transporter family protein [Bryobacteraceae bacterium]
MSSSKKKQRDEDLALEQSAPSSRAVHRAILYEGFEELARPSSALFWSALAAGLSMGLSLIAEGLLRAGLPEAPWRPLIVKLGYSMGFLVVVLGRQQLFTENTLTAVLPVLRRRNRVTVWNLARLWTVVFAGNILGAFLFAIFLMWGNAFDQQVRTAFIEIGREALRHTGGDAVIRGVVAGWLIALMVWLLPLAAGARFWVIIAITYFVGLGSLTHVIAGSIEVFAIAAINEWSWPGVLLSYTFPTLVGNSIGGILLVAALNHAQVVAGQKSSRQREGDDVTVDPGAEKAA